MEHLAAMHTTQSYMLRSVRCRCAHHPAHDRKYAHHRRYLLHVLVFMPRPAFIRSTKYFPGMVSANELLFRRHSAQTSRNTELFGATATSKGIAARQVSTEILPGFSNQGSMASCILFIEGRSGVVMNHAEPSLCRSTHTSTLCGAAAVPFS
jgi:hypothetical protein